MSKEVIRPSSFCYAKDKALLDDSLLELNDEQLRELSSLYEGIGQSFRLGKTLQGTVVASDADGVLVDIGYKSRGLIPRHEFTDHELKSFVPGSPIEVVLDVLENADGSVVLSYEKAKVARAWGEIMKRFENNEPVEGIVTHKVKGGLNVDVGVPAFLPGSQVDLQRVADFDQYVGQKIAAVILKVNKKRGNIIISRRKYLYDQRSEVRKEILDSLTEGQVIQGIVKNITNYGVFIDIGGVDGLLHITDMVWGRISHPSEIVKIGDTVTVKVLSFDKEHEKISLGMKQLTENPWEKAAKTLKIGDRVRGRISSVTDYGLFVEVAENIEGLVHISEISWTDRISNLGDRYHVGDEIEVLIVSFDRENRRMSLSIKQLEKNPWESIKERFAVGQKIKGTVSNVTDFGVFVQLIPGIDGLVHISDLSWTEHIEHPSTRYKVAEEVEAVILAIDSDNKKISLGIKQLTPDPWEHVEDHYSSGMVVDGEVTKITNFGAFIKLPNGIEGLVHNTTLMNEEGKKADEFFSVGQKTQFRVINVNKQEHKLGLSTKLEGKIETYKKEVREQAAPAHAPVNNAPRGNWQERHEKQDRHERHERQEKWNKESSATTVTSAQPKAKSSLQLALESAMQKAEDRESSNKD